MAGTSFNAAASVHTSSFGGSNLWSNAFELGLDYIDMGGWVMPPLLLTLALLWYGIGYRFSVLRGHGRTDVRSLVEGYAAGHWKSPKGLIQEAIERGWALKESGLPQLRLFLDDAFTEYEDHMQRFATLIRVIVNIAPLLGLLGTVTGMIETFDSLQDNALFSQSGGVASGISQAMLTTQLGLSIAIPGLILQSVLNRRQRFLAIQLVQVKELLSATPSNRMEKGQTS
jgi:biopolymer transport protein ExbB